jgi:hypothetical protein
MKLLSTVICAALVAVLSPLGTANAQVVSGNQLEIGPSGSNQVSDTYPNSTGAAIGEQNQVLGRSLAVGSSNYVGYQGALAIGSSNTVSGELSAAIGSGNNNPGYALLMVGSINYGGFSQEEGAPSNGAVFGAANYIGPRSQSVLVSGANNYVDAHMYDDNFASNTLGYGLVNRWSYSTVLGHYNDSSPSLTSGLLLAVGNGTDANNRSNALEVYASGKILMPRQGDILMGEFGN